MTTEDQRIAEAYRAMNDPRLICEMARVGDMTNELEVFVNTKEGGNIPHFHVWDKNTNGQKFHTCIEIADNRYFHHNGKEGVLNSRQRKALDGFLRQKPARATKFETNWDAILSFWNIGDSNMSVDLNQPQPDYSTIREN